MPTDVAGGGAPAHPETVVGVGVDLCAVARMARALDNPATAGLEDVFSPEEMAHDHARGRAAARLAARFAAKEAVLKALALCGGQGRFWRDIEILNDGDRPRVALGGRLAALAASAGVRRVLVSCAHEHTYATASAVALARSDANA